MTKLVRQEYELHYHISTAPAASQELDKIVALRLNALERLQLTDGDEVPWSEVEKLFGEYRKWWLAQPEQMLRETELAKRCVSRSALTRTLASNCRTHCFETFGGVAWVKWYLALGEVSEEVVELAQEYINHRCLETEHRTTPREKPHPSPRFSKVTLQKMRGEAPKYTGVQHKRSHANELRRKAKKLKNNVDRAEEDWRLGKKRKMTWHQWEKLQEDYKAVGM